MRSSPARRRGRRDCFICLACAHARDAAVSVLTKLGGQATASVPTVGPEAVAVLKSFIPAAVAPAINPIIDAADAAALPALEADAVTGIKTGLGIAITRIQALI